MALLSRTAESLYWVGRYVERAENMARLLDTGKRMSAIPGDSAHQSEWEPVLAAAGARQNYDALFPEINQRNVVEFIAYSPQNASSIVSCIERARDNARSMRTAFTIDMWEALNEFWLELRARPPVRPGDGGLAPFLDWIKRSCALFRGVADSTMLRNDSYDFLRLGTFIERADCTARLLDVKYYALLKPEDAVAGGVDIYQWMVVLRATSSLRAYSWIYGGGYEAVNIADFLILNPHSSRSLSYCMEKTTEHLNRLARLYTERHDAHEICASIYGELTDNSIDAIFQGGLHEFLTRFIARNNWLSAQIARDYYFSGMTGFSGPKGAAEPAGEAAPAAPPEEKNEQIQPFGQGAPAAGNRDRAAG